MFTVMKVGLYRSKSRCLQEWKSVFTEMEVGVYGDGSRSLQR